MVSIKYSFGKGGLKMHDRDGVSLKPLGTEAYVY